MNETASALTASASVPSGSDGGKGLPPGATINPDGSVTLALSAPFSVQALPSGAACTEVRELLFRRLAGADCRKIRCARIRVDAVIAKSLGISVPAAIRIRKEINLADLAAVIDVIGWLLQMRDAIPERAVGGGDGGFELPLLYPVSDGRDIYHTLHLRPLTRVQVRAAGRPDKDKFMANVLGHSTALPLWKASKIADNMDAADYFAAQTLILELMKRSDDMASSRVQGRRM